MPVKTRKTPWWLGRGTETCEHCGHDYPHGFGRHCAHCDASVCWLCAERDEEGLQRCTGCCSDQDGK